MIKLLVDGDMVVYRACSATETSINWTKDLWVMHIDLAETKIYIEELMRDIIENALVAHDYVGEYECIFCFSDLENNFRKYIYPPYKSNRKDKKRPMGFKPAIQWVKDNNKWEERPSLEADDCLGILATDPTIGETIIVSGDKDLKTIAGAHYDFLKKEYSVVSKEQALYNFYYQTLVGDSCDGYGGCPQVGKVSAKKILDKECSWDIVKKTYEKKGLTEEDALCQARLAHILTFNDINDLGDVTLWQPT